MALSPKKFIEESGKYFNIIEQRRTVKEIGLDTEKQIKLNLGEIDFSDVLEQLIEITVSLHRLYVNQQSIDNLSSWDTQQILKKSKIVALAGIIEIFKNYNNKEDSFWNYYSNKIGVFADENFNKKIFIPALLEEKIINANWDKTESFTAILAKETELSEYVLDDVINIFGIYWKYFAPELSVEEFINGISEEGYTITSLPQKLEVAEDLKRSFFTNRLSEFGDKIIEVLNILISLTNYIDKSEHLIQSDDFSKITEEFNEIYQIKDLSSVFKSNDNIEKYRNLFGSISLKKLVNIIGKLNSQTEIKLPNNKTIDAKEFLKMESLFYGNYVINEKEYSVLPNESYDLDYLCSVEKNKVVQEGNRYILRSNHQFSISMAPYPCLNESHFIYKNGKKEGCIWFSYKPLVESIDVVSEKLKKVNFEKPEKLLYELELTLDKYISAPSFSLNLPYLILLSQEKKNKKVEIIFSEDTTKTNSFKIDKNGVGYCNNIKYDLSDIETNEVFIYLVSDKQAFSTRSIKENTLNYKLPENILFDSKTKKIIEPSNKSYSSCSGKLVLFTNKKFDDKQLSKSASSRYCNNFGNYNVYEIDWLDKDNSLEINLNSNDKWSFLEPLEVSIDSKNKLESKFINYADNHLNSLTDVNFVISSQNKEFDIKELEIELIYNFVPMISNIKMGVINTYLDRNESHHIIDHDFIKAILPINAEASYGKYSINISYKGNSLHNYNFFVIPKLEVEEISDLFLEEDEIVLKINSTEPCFKNNKLSQMYLFDKLARCELKIKNKIVESQKLKYNKKAKLYFPMTELKINYEPEIICYRLIENNRLYTTDIIDYYNIDKTAFVAKVPKKEKSISLKVNSNIVKPLSSNSLGIIVEQLRTTRNYLNKPYNNVSIKVGKEELGFQVIWNPKVNLFNCKDFIFNPRNGVSFLMSYEGPSGSTLNLSVTDENEKSVKLMKVSCKDDINSRKFIKQNKNGSISIICDGKKWKDREFHISLDEFEVNTVNYIKLKGIYDYNKEAFGELNFKNENFEADLKSINLSLRTDPQNAYLFFEKGFIYSEMNELEKAIECFNLSLKYDLDNDLAVEYIELFKKLYPNSLLSNDLNKISGLAKKLYKDELLLEFK